MGGLDVLRRLFGGGGQTRGEGGQTRDGGLYIRVKCNACGEIVQARINPTAELSRSDEGDEYFVRKVLVGKQCFRSIEVHLRYADLRGTELSRDVRGGTSVE
jgi:hypothetical protein